MSRTQAPCSQLAPTDKITHSPWLWVKLVGEIRVAQVCPVPDQWKMEVGYVNTEHPVWLHRATGCVFCFVLFPHLVLCGVLAHWSLTDKILHGASTGLLSQRAWPEDGAHVWRGKCAELVFVYLSWKCRGSFYRDVAWLSEQTF